MPRLTAPTVTMLVLLAACGDGTGPGPAEWEGPSPTPYLVSPQGVRVNGVTRMLVIPAQLRFGAAPSISPAELRAQLFGSSDNGLVSRVFGLASGGRFALRGDVAPWVQTPVSRDVFVPDSLATYAIALADPHVDFRRYDSDGPDGIPDSGDDDGVVDGGVVIMIPEIDLGCPGPGIHPAARLRWGIDALDPPTPVPTQDVGANGTPIGIDSYTYLGAVECTGWPANAAPLTHELGHILFGLPDLYHQADNTVPANERWRGRRWVVGCWELMAAGSGWGCGTGTPPTTRVNATLGAWTRAMIGWSTPVEVRTDVDATYELLSPERGGTVLSFPVSAQERFLVEYRQATTADAIPGDGVLIYHVVDTLRHFIDPAGPRRYKVMLVEADADGALVRTHVEGGDRGVAADAFGTTVTTFSAATNPGAFSIDGTPLPFALEDISFDRSTGRAQLRVRPGG